MRLPAGGGPAVPIIDGVDGADDHAWAPDGTLFQATGAVLWALSHGGSGWTEVADFSDLSISLSRLAVSPDGDQIAMVAEVAALDLGTP
jgi:hypothetical protein